MATKHKHTYAAKRRPTGKWDVVDDQGRLESRIGVGFTRDTARKYAFLLNSGRMKIEKRNPLDMPHTGTPGHILGPQLQAKQDEERENFLRNKHAILRGIREQEQRDAAPVCMRGW